MVYFVITVKPVYKGQPQGITKMAFVDRWPLFGASETTYPIFMGRIKTGLFRQETSTRRCPYAQVWLYRIHACLHYKSYYITFFCL